MAVVVEDGIEKKRCNGCGQMKPLTDFSPDRTKGQSQGHRHCRCKQCKSEDARQRYRTERRVRQLLRKGQ